MRHNVIGRICVGWVNLDNKSREEAMRQHARYLGAVEHSQHDDPATADGLLEFNLAMLGLEIVEGGLGYSPPLGTLRAPPPLHHESWKYPAYIVPMEL